MLHPVLQIVGERDLGDRGVDGDLQLRPINGSKRALESPVILLIGIDNNRIIGDVGGDADILKQSARHGAAGRRLRRIRAAGALPTGE